MHRIQKRLTDVKGTGRNDELPTITIRKQMAATDLADKRSALDNNVNDVDFQSRSQYYSTMAQSPNLATTICAEFTEKFNSGDPVKISETVKHIRGLCTHAKELHKVTAVLVKNDLHKPLIHIVHTERHSPEAFHAAWALVNIMSCNDLNVCQTVVASGISARLINVLQDPSVVESTLEHCLWAICNIAGDNLLSLPEIMVLLEELPRLRTISSAVADHCSWLLVNLCARVSPQLYSPLCNAVIAWLDLDPPNPNFSHLLMASRRLVEAAATASSSRPTPIPGEPLAPPAYTPSMGQLMRENMSFHRIAASEVLRHDNKARTIFSNLCGSLTSQEDDIIFAMLHAGALDILVDICESLPAARRYSMWALSNAAVCKIPDVVQALVTRMNIFHRVIAEQADNRAVAHELSMVYSMIMHRVTQNDELTTPEAKVHFVEHCLDKGLSTALRGYFDHILMLKNVSAQPLVEFMQKLAYCFTLVGPSYSEMLCQDLYETVVNFTLNDIAFTVQVREAAAELLRSFCPEHFDNAGALEGDLLEGFEDINQQFLDGDETFGGANFTAADLEM